MDERLENKKKDLVVCDNCGCADFRVYISIIIDDARLYCADCGYCQIE